VLGLLVFLILVLITSLIFLIDTFSYYSIAAIVPRLYLVILIILSSIMIISLIRKNKGLVDFKNLNSPNKRVVLVLAVTAAYTFAISIVGFYLSTFLMMPISAMLLGGKKKYQIIMATVGVIGFIYLMFNVILDIRLPAGMLWAGM